MATSEKQKGYVKAYQEQRDVITIRPPLNTKKRWRAAANAQGYKSLQQFIITTVEAAVAAQGVEK